MIKKLLLSGFAVAANLLSYQAEAQLPANTYQFSALSGTYTEITGTNVAPAASSFYTSFLNDDVWSTVIPLGFTFNYCGVDYTQVVASTNGWVSFNSAISGSYTYNASTSINDIKPALMPLWDDLGGGVGTAVYTTTGTAPNRVFTIEFRNWRWNYSSSYNATISFQVRLYETSNLIQYQYRQEASTGNTSGSSGASIGIIDNMASTGYLVINNTTTAPVASSTTFTDNITTRPANGQIYQFKPMPAIDMKADSVVVQGPFCSNSSQPVSVQISNQGTATINTVDVHWQVDGVNQPPVTYNTASISNIGTAPANKATVLLGNVFFPDTNPRTIKAWVYLPNGLADEVNANDTIAAPVSSGLPGVVATITPGDTTICQGTGGITLDAGEYANNPIYIWNNGTIERTLNVTTSGMYVVKVQNNLGCFDYDTVNVSVHPNPVVNSIAIIDHGSGDVTFNVIGAYNVDSFRWDFNDGVVNTGAGTPGAINHQFDPGLYTVTLTVWNQCNVVVVTRVVEIFADPTSIGNISELQKQVRVFPNPSRTSVTISNDANIKMKGIAIFNLVGQGVYHNEKVNAVTHELNVSAFAAGIYNVIIDTEKGRITKKLEVIK